MDVNTQVGKLEVTRRLDHGKSMTRKLRQTGMIPGVCYGPGEEPISLCLEPKSLLAALDPEKRTNTLITLTVKAPDGATQQLTVMLRDWQQDALKGDVIHADFLRVRLDQEVTAVVPVNLIGKPEGVKLGGTLHQVYRQLKISCTPDKIPVKLEINVDALNMGDAMHVADLKLPDGVRALAEAGAAVCTVTAPKAEKTAAEEAAEAAAAAGEGVEGAVPVEGAAPVAGAPGAAPVAGAPAAPAPEKEGKGDRKKKKE